MAATVRWVKEGRTVPRAMRGMGLAFDPLSEEDEARLIKALEPRP